MSDKNKVIESAIEAWSSKKLVAIPTETVYGLGAPVNNEELIKKIFTVKERPFFDPLIVHISSIDMAKRYARSWTDTHQKLADKFWPGPLTIVVEKTDLISELITSGLDTVGLRMPNNEITLELIETLEHGVAAPSANKFTKTSPTCAEHVKEQFEESDVFVISDDPSQVGIESTIITLGPIDPINSLYKENKVIKILRPGIITGQEILECLGEGFKIEYGKTAFESNQKAKPNIEAPGQFNAHYRPEYPLTFIKSDKDITLWKRDFPDCEFKSLSTDPYITARELYSTMRKPLVPGKVRKCFILSPSIDNLSDKEKEVWQGIFNRLKKASTFTL